MDFVKIILIFIMLALAALNDVKKGSITNKFNLCWGICGILISFLMNGIIGLGNSLMGMLIPFCVLIVLFVLHVLGAGDIKLFMALGAFAGVNVIWLLIYSFLLCGICGLFLACGRLIGQLIKRRKNISVLDAVTRNRMYTKVPFAVFVLGAYIWYLMKGGISVGI